MKQILMRILLDLLFAAVIAFLAFNMARAVEPKARVIGMEWRAIGFVYVDAKYHMVADITDDAYPDQATCLQALKEMLAKMPTATIVGACLQVPTIKQVSTET